MLGLVFVLVLGAQLRTDALAAAPLGNLGAAPDFTLETHRGERTSLAEHLGRGPVIIDFWATWCGPCRKALPHLQEIYDRYRDRGLTVLAISQDDPRSQPRIGPFLRAQKLTFPVLLDSDSRVGRLYRVASVPATFLIDAEGRVVALHRGFREGDEKLLAEQVEALMAGLGNDGPGDARREETTP